MCWFVNACQGVCWGFYIKIYILLIILGHLKCHVVIIRSGFIGNMFVESDVGLFYIINEIDFHLYPNPAFNFINVAFNFDYFQNEETNLNIRTLTGKIIKSVPVSLSKGYNNMEIDLKDLPKGIYLLTINSFQTFRLEKRFIKM